MPYFEYSEDEVDYLRGRDPVLGAAMEQIGPVRREVIPDLFEALVHSIVGQQISSKAHQTVWNRIKNQLGEVTPSAVDALGEARLQELGISMRKAGYICGAARSVMNGEIAWAQLQELEDEAVCRELTRLSGVGQWTAEMLMTFSMQRRDVISYGDYGIRRGLRMLYRHREITPKLFERYRRRYSPCATVASLYLWAVAGGAIPQLQDPGEKHRPARRQ